MFLLTVQHALHDLFCCISNSIPTKKYFYSQHLPCASVTCIQHITHLPDAQAFLLHSFAADGNQRPHYHLKSLIKSAILIKLLRKVAQRQKSSTLFLFHIFIVAFISSFFHTFADSSASAKNLFGWRQFVLTIIILSRR